MRYEGEANTAGLKGTARRLANAGYVRLANQGEKTTVAEEKLCAVGSPWLARGGDGRRRDGSGSGFVSPFAERSRTV